MIAWGSQYLGAFDHLCEAVNAVALAHSLDRDAGWVTRKRGGYADTWRQRHDRGCEISRRPDQGPSASVLMIDLPAGPLQEYVRIPTAFVQPQQMSRWATNGLISNIGLFDHIIGEGEQ